MRKKIITRIIGAISVLIVAIIGFFISGKSENNEQQLKNIRVNEVTRSIFYAPQYVAINKGFFEEQGLNIELTTAQGSDAVMTSVLSNQVEIGFAGPETSIYVYNEGKEDYCQVFAQLTKKDGSFLVSKEANENFKWEDVKGKTIIPGRKGGVPYMTLEYVLKKNGIDPQKDVTLDDSIKFDLMAGAFTAGDAEYVTLFEPTASLTQEQGKGYIVAAVGEAAGEIPYTGYCAKKSYIENNEEIIQSFTNAVAKGQKWVEEHSSLEIAQEITSFFPDTDVKLLEKVIQNYKDIDVWNTTPVLKEDSFELLQEVMSIAGELQNKVPYDKVVNNKYAEKANQNMQE